MINNQSVTGVRAMASGIDRLGHAHIRSPKIRVFYFFSCLLLMITAMLATAVDVFAQQQGWVIPP